MADTTEFEVFKRHLRAAFPFNAMHTNGHSEWSDTFFIDNHMHISRIFHLLRIHCLPAHRNQPKGFNWPAIFAFFFARFTPFHDAVSVKWPCLWRRGSVAPRVLWEALEDLILGHATLLEKITNDDHHPIAPEERFSTAPITKTWLYNTLIEWYHPDLSSQDLSAKDILLVSVLEEAQGKAILEIETAITTTLPTVDPKELVEFTITRIFGKALKNLFPPSGTANQPQQLSAYHTLTQPHIYRTVAQLIQETGVDFIFARLYFRDLVLFSRYDFFGLKRKQCPISTEELSNSNSENCTATFWESPKAIGLVWKICHWVSTQACTGNIPEAYQLTCKIFHISCSIFNQSNWYFDNLRAIKAFLHRQDCWVHIHPLNSLFWFNLNGTPIYALLYYWMGGIDYCEDRLFFDEAEFCAIRGIQRLDLPLCRQSAHLSLHGHGSGACDEEEIGIWTAGALPCNRVLVQRPEDPLEAYVKQLFFRQHLGFYGALGSLCVFCICFSVYIASVVNKG